jgi:hypothetical protein
LNKNLGYGGKTGPRKVTLTDSLPYLLDWYNVHPERYNKNAVLFRSYKTGGSLDSNSIYKVYEAHRRRLVKLLQSGKIPEEEDKAKIEKHIEKPSNPYVQRHFSLTEHALIIKTEFVTCQMAGWKKHSNARKVHSFER